MKARILSLKEYGDLLEKGMLEAYRKDVVKILKKYIWIGRIERFMNYIKVKVRMIK